MQPLQKKRFTILLTVILLHRITFFKRYTWSSLTSLDEKDGIGYISPSAHLGFQALNIIKHCMKTIQYKHWCNNNNNNNLSNKTWTNDTEGHLYRWQNMQNWADIDSGTWTQQCVPVCCYPSWLERTHCWDRPILVKGQRRIHHCTWFLYTSWVYFAQLTVSEWHFKATGWFFFLECLVGGPELTYK